MAPKVIPFLLFLVLLSAQALASRFHCSSTSPRLRELNKSRKIVAVSKGLVGGSIPRFSPSYEPPIHDPPLP
ncbi:hypothetical protein SAY87_000952 [Trapa incisa]|uniref:Uncharacterized protein n=1 Tax=Trapa incisa TaxID=236973 RepID=A0AAN7GG35_9MYRT|nr:hypothetical protein SAY87_000952 [Trapa incisa]